MQQSVLGGSVSLSVVVHGKEVREIFHEEKMFIEAHLGSRFSLRISNNSPKRVLAVITVDGLSVMDGKVGKFDSSGYVLSPWSSHDIPGWRLSDAAVAKFFFGTLDQAYATQMDAPTNIGVIGCAVFNEPDRTAFRPHVLYSKGRDSAPQTFGAFNSSLEGQGTGVGFGEEATHHVGRTTFNKLLEPSAIFAIYYDTREKLIQKGVPVDKPTVAVANPFPGQPGYCTPPKNWPRS
ncbi:MAG: hypothetical protein WCV85_00720 [Patescibacteria group bacterium]|jgi:hypothetical protein